MHQVTVLLLAAVLLMSCMNQSPQLIVQLGVSFLSVVTNLFGNEVL